MKPPLIGLSGRRTTGARQVGFLPELHHAELDVYFADYALGVIEAGGLPVHLPLDVDPAVAARRLDGLLLSGGADVDPSRFGADRHPAVEIVEPERDDFEFRVLDAALVRGIPVLGICRGLQVLNVHLGGTLSQHVAEHSRYDVGAAGIAHDVEIVAGSILGSLYGTSVAVNSLHHQTVDRLSDELAATAHAGDGTIEGVEAGDTVLAVQWHPEMMPSRSDDPLFRWLVDRARY